MESTANIGESVWDADYYNVWNVSVHIVYKIYEYSTHCENKLSLAYMGKSFQDYLDFLGRITQIIKTSPIYCR